MAGSGCVGKVSFTFAAEGAQRGLFQWMRAPHLESGVYNPAE